LILKILSVNLNDSTIADSVIENEEYIERAQNKLAHTESLITRLKLKEYQPATTTPTVAASPFKNSPELLHYRE